MNTYSIVGWYHRQNCGDDAFVDAFNLLLPGEKTFSERQSPGNITILGGGDVIKKHYLDNIQGEFYIIGAGMGYPSEIELLKGQRVKKAYFRNKEDVGLARQAGIDADYIPDLVFALSAPGQTRIKRERKRCIVILNDAINPSYSKREKAAEMAYAEYFKWEMADALSYLSEWYDLEFLPFSRDRYNMDYVIHHEVIRRMEKPANTLLLDPPSSPKNALETLEGADLVITMKFHGAVFSTIVGTPFVNVGLSRKLETFCLENSFHSFCLSPYSFTKQKLLNVVKNAENVRAGYILQQAEKNRLLLKQTMANIRKEFNGESPS